MTGKLSDVFPDREDRAKIKRALQTQSEMADQETIALMTELGEDPNDEEVKQDLADATEERDAYRSLADRIDD